MKSIYSLYSLGLGLLVGGAAINAHAQLVKFTCTNPNATVGASPVTCASFYERLQTEVNRNLPSVETGKYTKGVANANSMASAGTGVVYGSSFRYGLVGAGIGLGVDLGDGNSVSDVVKGDFDAKKFAGFGAQSSAVLGINPAVFTTSPWLWGAVDPTRLRVYVSFLAMDRDFDDVNAKFSNFGVVAQYRLIQERSIGLNMLKWGGVDVSTGVKYSNLEAGFKMDISESVTESGQTITATGPLNLSAKSSNFSIPIEVSTSVRTLYVLNFVGGLGADLNFGNTSASVNYSPNITGPAGSEGTAKADVGGDSSPAAINMRGFVGAQFEFAVGSIYANLQKSLSSGVLGANVGLNLFW